MSITCARCHNHPLEKWTQDEYWAFANLFHIELGGYGVHTLQAIFFLIGVVVMVRFVLNARRVEPFTES